MKNTPQVFKNSKFYSLKVESSKNFIFEHGLSLLFNLVTEMAGFKPSNLGLLVDCSFTTLQAMADIT
jgi:hypothetical protein